jgi:hypothetical protein
MGLIAFLIVTILSGFTHQKMATRKVADKNVALALAELRMQELHKFRATQLTPGISHDWIIHRNGEFSFFQTDPDDPDQFLRTTSISRDAGDVLGHKMIIQVMVQFGRSDNTYPFRVVLSTKRGL